MQNLLKRCLAGLLIVVATGAVNVMLAQGWTPGRYMKESLDATLAKAAFLEKGTDYGFREGICILGAYLDESAWVKWDVSLSYGDKIALIGGGDSDASDLDIKVYDDDGDLVAKDTETDASPVVNFTASSSGSYTFELSLYACDASGSFVTMVIFEEGAYSVPVSRLEYVSDLIVQKGTQVNEITSVSYHDVDNQWCLFGSLLGSGESSTISNLNMGDIDHVIIGIGDSEVEDADLCLIDPSGDEDCDTARDAIPVIQTTTSASQRYKLKITNYSSDGTALVVASILDK